MKTVLISPVSCAPLPHHCVSRSPRWSSSPPHPPRPLRHHRRRLTPDSDDLQLNHASRHLPWPCWGLICFFDWLFLCLPGWVVLSVSVTTSVWGSGMRLVLMKALMAVLSSSQTTLPGETNWFLFKGKHVFFMICIEWLDSCRARFTIKGEIK